MDFSAFNTAMAQNRPGTKMPAVADAQGIFVPTARDYKSYSDAAYGNALRTLEPTFDRMQSRFEQQAINKGFAPSSEGYNTSFDQMMRGMNDLTSKAAFDAMQFGADRYDKDRAFGEQTRQFDETFGLQELLGLESVMGSYRDDAYRDAVFNAQQDQQQFNNLFNMMGLAPGSSFQPANIGNVFSDQARINAANQAREDQMWQGISQNVADLAGTVDWGSIFNRGGGDRGPDYGIDTSIFTSW